MSTYNPLQHYISRGPTHEFGDLEECAIDIKNIGWTLGNDCPYRCTHCYSMSARVKGANMTIEIIDRVVDQLAKNGVETVNLGGNEPIFTNGIDINKTLLPYIVRKLKENNIEVGLTTSGITLLHLYKKHKAEFDLLNDIDISLDSPFEEEHNKNRGAKLYPQAIECLEICQRENKDHTIITAAMSWNFTKNHLQELLKIALKYDANIRINPLKPVDPSHVNIALSPQQYYDGFSYLMQSCDNLDIGEPPLAAVSNYQQAKRCPCGRTSFRIHSITPEGAIHVSPCVYLHDYKSSLDLVKHDLYDIIRSSEFKVFRQRNFNPEQVEGCSGCNLLSQCGGGCAARSYLHHVHETGEKSFKQKDAYCPKDIAPSVEFPPKPIVKTDKRLVHMDYLCTWIGKPKRV